MSWFERVPKVELHLHLEGAIPLDILWELIQKYGGDVLIPDIAALKRRFTYRSFQDFIEAWIWKNNFLREYEDFTLIAEAVAGNLLRQNIVYAEVFFTPSRFFHHGLKTQELTEAIRSGFSRIDGIKISLVTDLCRDNGSETAMAVLTEINEVKELGVIGISIGGSEYRYPPEPFEEVFEKARKLGFHTSAHAGEAAGVESIWGAIRTLKVERIGHGTRACEDDSLVYYLAEHRVPLEICPVSNVKIGVVGSIKEHPIRRYFESGLFITVNTDDPMMFGNSLASEYETLELELGFSRQETRKLILNGIRASWLSEEEKKKLTDKLHENLAWNT